MLLLNFNNHFSFSEAKQNFKIAQIKQELKRNVLEMHQRRG